MLIRSLGNAEQLESILNAFSHQYGDYAVRITVLECGTNPAIEQVCSRFDAQLVTLTEAQFHPAGRSLNIGLKNLSSDLVVILSSVAMPVGHYFLESCLEPFCDPKVAAVRCLSLDSEQHAVRWFEPKVIEYSTIAGQEQVEAGDGWDMDYPSTACCVVRREAWQEVPFDEEMEFSADKKWASETLAKDWKMIACADAMWISIARRSLRELDEIRLAQQLGYYKLTGHRPMSWTRFFTQSLKVLLISPIIGARYLHEQLALHVQLLTIPIQFRFNRKSGSISEFDRHA